MRGGPARCTLGAKAVDNGGLRYGAMESALRPPLPTATQALAELQIQPGLDQRLRAKHHRRDPRKQTPSGRHQIGIPAGFKSESVAGFLLECVAGFVGIRTYVTTDKIQLKVYVKSPDLIDALKRAAKDDARSVSVLG